MSLIETIILNLFDVLMFIIIGTKTINNQSPKINLTQLLKIGILITGSGLIGYYIQKQTIASMCILIFGYIMFYFYFKTTAWEIFYLYMVSFVFLSSIQFITILLTNLMFKNVEFNFKYGILSQGFSLVLTLILSNLVPLNIIYKLLKRNNNVVKFLIINIVSIFLMISIYWYTDIKGMLNSIIYIFAVVAITVMINFVLLYNGVKNEQNLKEIQMYKTYFPIIEKLMDEIRARQHEFDNHVQVLKLIEKFEINSEVRSYIEDISKRNEISALSKMDNKIIAGFLYSKYSEAVSKNIDFKINL